LTEQWWSLPSYQRTRGALQLLAAALSTGRLPRAPLLSPGDLPLDSPWRQQLWAQLDAPPAYEAVLTYELLGPDSVCRQLSDAPAPPAHDAPRPPAPVVTPDTEFSGALLRAVRESQGIDLREISDRTKIGSAHLEAIEAGDFRSLPAPVYVRGFVRELGKLLRLDPAQVARTYLRRYRRYLEERGEGPLP